MKSRSQRRKLPLDQRQRRTVDGWLAINKHKLGHLCFLLNDSRHACDALYE